MNKEDSKISDTIWPYYWLESDSPLVSEKNLAIFFGADFYNMPDINVEEFVKKTNQCLYYVRKNCHDCKLIYRPHPDEDKETNLLNLELFEIQRDGQISEIFLWENRNKIKYVFSVCSTSSSSAFNMGMNSYSFYPFFGGVFMGYQKKFVDTYLGDLPGNLFINDLRQVLTENNFKPRADLKLEDDLQKVLKENHGEIIFTVVEIRLVMAIRGLARLIKLIDRNRKLKLIISNHHRWSEGFLEQLRLEFDEVIIFPRHFYSLKPRRLWLAFKTSRKIKNYLIGKGSVLIGFAHHDFVENCFISYNKELLKLSFMPKEIWDVNFNLEKLGFEKKNFLFNRASLFYNNLFEPLLGLNRTRFNYYGKNGGLYFVRFAERLENIYNHIYLMRDSSHLK